MTNKTFITKEGLEKLKKELQYLKTVKRKEIAERIKEAQELGDISENAEYTEAKEEQMTLDGRILELGEVIRNVEVIEKSRTSGVVSLGSNFTVKGPNGTTVTYTIVGSNEADPHMGLISHESPMGRAFLDKKVGDKVEVTAPKGTIVFEILETK